MLLKYTLAISSLLAIVSLTTPVNPPETQLVAAIQDSKIEDVTLLLEQNPEMPLDDISYALR